MLPELKRLPNNRIASLVGIALHLRQSDETKFKSHYFGGRSAVQGAVYGYHGGNTVLNRLFVAVTACVHKLLADGIERPDA